MPRDREEPRSQAVRLAQAIQRLRCDDEHILKDIGRVVRVPQHPGGQVEQCRGIPVIDLPERAPVAAKVRGNQSGVGAGVVHVFISVRRIAAHDTRIATTAVMFA